jgi:hypothetical protein
MEDKLTTLRRERGELKSRLMVLELQIERLERIPRVFKATFSRVMDRHVRVTARSYEEAKMLAEKKAKRTEPAWRGARRKVGGRWMMSYLAPLRKKENG